MPEHESDKKLDEWFSEFIGEPGSKRRQDFEIETLTFDLAENFQWQLHLRVN